MSLANTTKRGFYSCSVFWHTTLGSITAVGQAYRQSLGLRRALKELETMRDDELADIGLCRSDLNPEDLALAGKRRSAQQAAIRREMLGLAHLNEILDDDGAHSTCKNIR